MLLQKKYTHFMLDEPSFTIAQTFLVNLLL